MQHEFVTLEVCTACAEGLVAWYWSAASRGTHREITLQCCAEHQLSRSLLSRQSLDDETALPTRIRGPLAADGTAETSKPRLDAHSWLTVPLVCCEAQLGAGN